ncbi:hypothetical protein PCANC_05012 [Puccinia coronata f. sp. avenae]|nr:hypothetical protein PCANC_05012 [Puccinia coronata f. sp. avenae]PLW22800.1 hypothetical protein PCASD_12158 [Puccinia coronata f. sp. avenae]
MAPRLIEVGNPDDFQVIARDTELYDDHQEQLDADSVADLDLHLRDTFPSFLCKLASTIASGLGSLRFLASFSQDFELIFSSS